MDKRNEKIAAAISAVMSYIKTEEEISPRPLPVVEKIQPAQAPVLLKMWGISGRQTIMQVRNMMQMRAFHRIKERGSSPN